MILLVVAHEGHAGTSWTVSPHRSLTRDWPSELMRRGTSSVFDDCSCFRSLAFLHQLWSASCFQGQDKPLIAGNGVKCRRRDINGNLPRGPLRGSKMTDVRRSRTEFPADLRLYQPVMPIGAGFAIRDLLYNFREQLILHGGSFR